MNDQLELMLYPGDQLVKMQSQLRSMHIDMTKMRKALFAKQSADSKCITELRAEIAQLRAELWVMASYQQKKEITS